MLRVAFIGGGGVGKSTLAYSFSKYLNKKGLKTRIANMDPGCKHVKYKPFFDLREHYSLDEVMSEQCLGPNGALKRIYRLAAKDDEVREGLQEFKGDVLLLDTVGNMELFLFEAQSNLIKGFSDIVFFVVDNECIEDLVVLKALNAVQALKYCLPTITVANKSDLLKRGKKQRKLKGFEAVDAHLKKLLEEIGQNEKVVFVSAMDRRGFKALFDELNEARCACGDTS